MTSFSKTDPFKGTLGPRDAEIVIVGEAWGAEEAGKELPFQGASGALLRKLLRDAGIDPERCLLTNVINQRPPGNDFSAFLFPNSAKESPFNGVFPRPALEQSLRSLYELLQVVTPKLIITCGNWPLWALTDCCKIATVKGYKLPSGVGNWRGSQVYQTRGTSTPRPVLPIFHPSLILRDYTAYYPTLHDLKSKVPKALKGAWKAPELKNNHFRPSYQQVMTELEAWHSRLRNGQIVELSVDIETYRRRHITVLGLADGQRQLCIPFFYYKPGGEYVDYFTLSEEVSIIKLAKEILEHPLCWVIGQNFAYDHHYLRRVYGINAVPKWDTMVLHHLCWPGTPRGLDYLSSLYCEDHVYWKEESNDWDGKGDPVAMWKYNCTDTAKTFEIAQVLKTLVKTLGLEAQAEEQMDFWRVANEAARKGVNYSNREREQIKKELSEVGEKISDFLLNCMPEDLRFAPSGKPWYSSPQHTAFIFYKVLKIQPVLHRKTKQPTTDATSIDTLKKRAPYLRSCLEALTQMRSIGVYEKNFLSTYTGYDGRMRCHFDIAGTTTFRWSSSTNGFGEGGNLQNIPE